LQEERAKAEKKYQEYLQEEKAKAEEKKKIEEKIPGLETVHLMTGTA